MRKAIRKAFAILSLSLLFISSQAQPVSNQPVKKETRPYKILTSGKQITVKSTKNIQNIMLWTTDGHRVVEQKEINNSSYSFIIPINEKIYFLMIGMDGGKIYTEKIGIR